MSLSVRSLQKSFADRALISLRREEIESHALHGFVLGYSEDLVLLQRVYDFYLDGWMLLRRRDITSLKAGETDRFQRELLSTEKLLDGVDFDFRGPLDSYESFLASRPAEELVIVEDEPAEVFLIGRRAEVGEGEVAIRTFDGAARWKDSPERIDTARITSCQVGSNYLQFYHRHFERIGA